MITHTFSFEEEKLVCECHVCGIKDEFLGCYTDPKFDNIIPNWVGRSILEQFAKEHEHKEEVDKIIEKEEP